MDNNPPIDDQPTLDRAALNNLKHVMDNGIGVARPGGFPNLQSATVRCGCILVRAAVKRGAGRVPLAYLRRRTPRAGSFVRARSCQPRQVQHNLWTRGSRRVPQQRKRAHWSVVLAERTGAKAIALDTSTLQTWVVENRGGSRRRSLHHRRRARSSRCLRF